MTYEQDAARTASPAFYGEYRTRLSLEMNLTAAAAAANRLNEIKKSTFYGKGTDEGPKGLAKLPEEKSIAGQYFTTQERDVLHGVIGIITEAGELAENLLENKGTDNIKEELGDVMWYIALTCRALGISIEDVCNANINKLKTRYPEKFSEEKALNRDLNAEAVALEYPQAKKENDYDE